MGKEEIENKKRRVRERERERESVCVKRRDSVCRRHTVYYL